MTATKGTKNMSFEYDIDGLRISKTVNGVTTNYIYDGDLLVAEYTDTKIVVYIYDANGSPIGFKYKATGYAEDLWDVYWYGKNLQGDIVAVYSSDGTKLISYKYNAWGVTTKSYSNNGASTTAIHNNLTYRGYYYDADLGMYYLQSRYYDAKICRFISSDQPDVILATPVGLTDKNLYAYCDNNPVMRVDYDGKLWHWLVGTVVGAVGAGIVASAQGKEGDEFWGSVANGAVSGFASGLATDFIVVFGCSSVGGIVVGAISGGVGNSLGNLVENEIVGKEIDWCNIAVDAGFGALTGALFGAIDGPQDSMMDVVKSRAGKKTLERGIDFGYAITKTSARELNKIGTTFVEEALTSFTSWFVKEYTKYFVGG